MPAGNRATTANRKIPGTHFGSWEVKGRIRRHLNVHDQAQGETGVGRDEPDAHLAALAEVEVDDAATTEVRYLRRV